MATPLTPADLAQLQQLMLQMQLDVPPSSTQPLLSAQPQPHLHTPHPQLTLSTDLAQQQQPPPVHSYQSLCTQVPLGLPTGSNGHPAPCLTSAPEPFLGFSSLGTGMTGQVCQQRLASSAATQPRQPQLPSHGSRHRQGPAVRPQPLHWVPRIEDCVSNINSEVVVRLAVKVYPPQVSSPPSNISSINFIFSKCQTRTCSTTNTSCKPS